MCSRSVAAPISMLVRLAGVSRVWHSSLSHRIVRSASSTVSSTLAHSMSNSNGEITAGSMFGARAEEGREGGAERGAKPAKKGGRARHPVKAAALQLASGPDKSANLETATRLILKAKSLGAEVRRAQLHSTAHLW